MAQRFSVIVITRDEEANLRSCLESVKWADEIVVIDQSSGDRTKEIAKEYTDKIFVTPAKGTCNPDRMFGISKASFDWIIFLDADELVPPDLKEEIQTILSDPKEYTCFYIGRRNFFLGKWIRSCGWHPAYSIKLFCKGHAYFPPEVHHDGCSQDGKTGYFKAKTLHYSYNTLSQYLAKLDRFTTCSSQEAFKKDARITISNFAWCFLFKPAFYFFRKYFIWGGFRDGFRGFFIAFSSGLTLFMHYSKIWELQNNTQNKLPH